MTIVAVPKICTDPDPSEHSAVRVVRACVHAKQLFSKDIPNVDLTSTPSALGGKGSYSASIVSTQLPCVVVIQHSVGFLAGGRRGGRASEAMAFTIAQADSVS